MRKSFLALLCLGGCMSMAQKTRPQTIASLQQGVTTEEQAIAMLGEPSAVMTTPDGKKADTWTNVGTRIDPMSFLPIAAAFVPMGSLLIGSAGPLLSGAKTQTNSLTLTFDSRGLLADKTMSDTQTAMNTGLLRQ